MTHGLRTTAHSLIFLFLLFTLSAFQSATAVSATSCFAPCFIEIGSPVDASVGPYHSVEISYANIVNDTVTGVVFMVVHNHLGQTVQISTATLVLSAGANGTAYPVSFGLAPGQYSATLFTTSTAGTAISFTTTVSFTV